METNSHKGELMQARKSLWLALGAVLLLAAVPIKLSGKEPKFAGRIIRNVTYVRRGLQPLRMTIYIPAGEAKNLPCVLVIHGGGFIGGVRSPQMEPLSITLANKGMVVFNIEYRLAPWATMPAPVEDVRCGLRWIAKHGAGYGADPTRLGVTGESAGGFLSAMSVFPLPEQFTDQACPEGSTQTPQVKAGVFYYGLYDLAKSWDSGFPGGRLMLYETMFSTPKHNPEKYRKYSPASYERAGLPPILILAAEKDHLLPESKDLYATLKSLGDPVEMKIYPAAKHGFAVYLDGPPGQEGLDAAAEFFQKLL